MRPGAGHVRGCLRPGVKRTDAASLSGTHPEKFRLVEDANAELLRLFQF